MNRDYRYFSTKPTLWKQVLWFKGQCWSLNLPCQRKTFPALNRQTNCVPFDWCQKGFHKVVCRGLFLERLVRQAVQCTQSAMTDVSPFGFTTHTTHTSRLTQFLSTLIKYLCISLGNWKYTSIPYQNTRKTSLKAMTRSNIYDTRKVYIFSESLRRASSRLSVSISISGFLWYD